VPWRRVVSVGRVPLGIALGWLGRCGMHSPRVTSESSPSQRRSTLRRAFKLSSKIGTRYNGDPLAGGLRGSPRREPRDVVGYITPIPLLRQPFPKIKWGGSVSRTAPYEYERVNARAIPPRTPCRAPCRSHHLRCPSAWCRQLPRQLPRPVPHRGTLRGLSWLRRLAPGASRSPP